MNFELDGRVCIVTGASRGLGWSICEGLLAEGASVLAVARTSGSLDELARRFPDALRVHRCDLGDLDQAALLPIVAQEELGSLDVVVNNAGVAPAVAFAAQTREDWQRTLTLNLLAAVAILQGAEPYFRAGGGGKVVNVASVGGLRGKAGLVSYTTSKGALIQLTRSLAMEWAPIDVQVNAIAPGGFGTEMQQAVLDDPELRQRRIRRIPAKRLAEPAELAPLACYLASPLSRFVTGAVYTIDGGEEAKL